MAVASKHLILEEFLTLPEEQPPLEFINGLVTQKVSPKGRHSVLQTAFVQRLNESARQGKPARALTELRVTFADASVVPDISVFRWERIPVDASGEIADTFLEAPDIAIEIASPDQSITALVRRCLWYVTHGVQVALLVDPADHSLLAFRPDQPAVAWHGADRIDLHEVLPDFDLSVDQLFASLRHG
jgi:Uma2 family endonuclease